MQFFLRPSMYACVKARVLMFFPLVFKPWCAVLSIISLVDLGLHNTSYLLPSGGRSIEFTLGLWVNRCADRTSVRDTGILCATCRTSSALPYLIIQ